MNPYQGLKRLRKLRKLGFGQSCNYIESLSGIETSTLLSRRRGAICCNYIESLSGIETRIRSMVQPAREVATILNPYQGLKQFLGKMVHQTLTRCNYIESLSGIETIEDLISCNTRFAVATILNPYQGLKRGRTAIFSPAALGCNYIESLSGIETEKVCLWAELKHQCCNYIESLSGIET